MFSFTRKKAEESKFGRALERMAGRRGLMRQRSTRAHSAPPRDDSTTVQQSSPVAEELSQPPRPIYNRVRSASCPALDWFAGDMAWTAVEESGRLERTGSYRSVQHEGPELDMRHDCVKKSSPVVVHQTRPYSITPLSAEVMTMEDIISPTAGRSAPPPTPVRHVSYDATSRGTVDHARAAAIEEIRYGRARRPFLAVSIPGGALSPPLGVDHSIWADIM